MSEIYPASDPSVSPPSAASEPAQEMEGDRQSPSTLSTEPPPSYVKLAMRNMVKKGGTSLYHFALTAGGLLAALVGLAYLTR